MKRNTLLVGSIVFAAVFAGPVHAQSPDFKKPLTKLDLKDGDSIVFLGDSITHQCLYTQYVETYFYTRFPKMRLKLHNAGVGGATAWDALQRFDKDVAAYKPKYVTVLLGMNDGRYRPFDKQIFDTYRKDMTEVIARIRKAGATPVLMTPTMYDSRAARMRKRRRKIPEPTLNQYNAVLAYYGTWLREVAADNGYGFVDMFARLNALTLSARKSNPKFTVIPDSVHPGPPGQVVMAYSILRDLVPQRTVSSILIVNSRARASVRSSGGKISGFKRTADSVEFTFHATALPWVLPDDAQQGVKLLRIALLANREVVQILNMPRGHYKLTIDGDEVGTFSHNSLFAGLKLHNSKTTPQYKQAMAIALLNKKRNAGPVRSLRNEWRTFQQYARLKRQLASMPDNEALKKRVAAMEAKLEGMDERIKKHRQDAKKIEDEIFRTNQPKPRKYVLKRDKLAQLKGKVTLDGKPLAGATVAFMKGTVLAAAGKTDEDGSYRLATGGVPGVPPGQYVVVISKKSRAAKGQESLDLIPGKYSNPRKTILAYSVAEGENTVNFSLKSK